MKRSSYQFDSEHSSWRRTRQREPQTKGQSTRQPSGRAAPPKRGPAKTLEPGQLKKVLAYIAKNSSVPEADRLKVLFSIYAGLRVSEIAGLRMADVTDAEGRIGTHLRVRSNVAKNGRERSIPIHAEVKNAINAFRDVFPGIDQFAISRRYKKLKVQSVNALTAWFHRTYEKVGLQGCSSHSGRRTFVTGLARAANHYGNSLRDVQLLAGHARLDTTERYIEPSHDLFDLVSSLGQETGRPSQGRGA